MSYIGLNSVFPYFMSCNNFPFSFIFLSVSKFVFVSAHAVLIVFRHIHVSAVRNASFPDVPKSFHYLHIHVFNERPKRLSVLTGSFVICLSPCFYLFIWYMSHYNVLMYQPIFVKFNVCTLLPYRPPLFLRLISSKIGSQETKMWGVKIKKKSQKTMWSSLSDYREF